MQRRDFLKTAAAIAATPAVAAASPTAPRQRSTAHSVNFWFGAPPGHACLLVRDMVFVQHGSVFSITTAEYVVTSGMPAYNLRFRLLSGQPCTLTVSGQQRTARIHRFDAHAGGGLFIEGSWR